MLKKVMNSAIAGDTESRLVLIQMQQTEEEMTPLCRKWMLELAEAGNPEARLLLVERALNRYETGYDWLTLEQWCLAALPELPSSASQMLACLYDKTFEACPNEKLMLEYLKKGVEHGNPACCIRLAEYYYLSPSLKHEDLPEIRDLLWNGLQVCCDDEDSWEMLVDVCEDLKDWDGYVQAVRRWIKSCPDSSFPLLKMGECYRYGDGVRANPELTLKYYQKAANLGDCHGMYEVGECYANGRGVRRNYSRALDYYRRALAAGCELAYARIGMCYQKGLGVRCNPEEAIKNYEKGVEASLADSCLALADMCLEGIGMEKDYKRCAELLDAACEYGIFVDEDKELYESIIAKCAQLGIPSSASGAIPVTHDGLIEAVRNNDTDEISLRLYNNLKSDPGREEDMHNALFLIKIKQMPPAVVKDFVALLRELASEYPHAAESLGDMYYHGYGVRRNYASSLLFYRKALEFEHYKNDIYPKIILGFHEDKFKGGRSEVHEWIQRAIVASHGSWAGSYLLGLLYYVGLYLPEDKQKAEQYFAEIRTIEDVDVEEDLRFWQSGGKTLRECVRLI